MKALEITDLEKIYPNGLMALKGINLEVNENDFFALLGPNGAGKSTTIGIVTSLIKKTRGKIKIFGFDLDTDLNEAKSMIGVVPQEYNFSQFETPLEIVLNQGGYYGIRRKTAYDSAEKYLTQLGLWPKRNDPSRTLSGGLKRRLLILDEPTAGVDVELRRSMWHFLTDINRLGTTIVLTTHYLEEAENLCRNVAIIDKGDIIENTTMKALLNKMNTERFILDLKSPVDKNIAVDGYKFHLIDQLTIEVEITREQNLNDLFESLSKENIKVLSMRNKSNRLEELFINLLDDNMA